MARIEWSRVFIIHLSILVVIVCTYAQTKRVCMRGLPTVGYTDPHGDIVIEYGNPLNITCILHDEYVQQHGANSSKNLYFTRDRHPIPDETIEILNSSSIRLHVENPPTGSTVYTCKLKDVNQGVCYNNVFVETKPLPVNDFECISYNFENLTCTWTQPDNYIKTTYNLTTYFPGRAGRPAPMKCFHVIKDNFENKKMSCWWTISSTPSYNQTVKEFYFEIRMTNVFGTTTQKINFAHFQHVLSDPPANLTPVNVTSNSIFLRWSIPFGMQAYPPGLQHRVMYQSEYGDKDWQFGGIMTSNNDEMVADVYFNLTGLKYAHALYDIRVSMRSNAAVPDDELMWSKNASITIKTMSKKPGAPPPTYIGSFEIVPTGNSLDNNDMYVYWQQIPEEIRNGEDFSYHIALQGNTSVIESKTNTSSYVQFSNINAAGSYTVHIWSQNCAGRSEKESIVYVPKQSERIGEPMSFTKIAFDNGTYELSWEPPKQRSTAPVKNYTIFWCTHDSDRPYQCSGYLTWFEIAHDKTVYTITVPEDKINQFAISANSETSSSGMVWTTCTVIYNKTISKMETVYITHVDVTFIQLSWKLDCSGRIGHVKGFIVYYCSIVSPTVTSCEGPEQTFTIYGNSTTNQANITNLKPYQTYRLAVSVMTEYTTQSMKSTYLNVTTLEEAPNSPTNIRISNVTNSSVTIMWQKPIITNGQLKGYKIVSNDDITDASANLEEYMIPNLISYTEYNISVKACTIKCSKPSPVQVVKTKGGYPSKISQPSVVYENDSYITVEWQRPSYPRGKNDIYEVKYKEKLQNENGTTALFNVTGTRYSIDKCGADGKYNNFYISVRAVNILDGKRYEGSWSDELELYCRTSPNWWLGALIPLCFFLVFVLFYMAKKMYFHCREMGDVDVKLPPGLAPSIATDFELSHLGGPKLSEEQSHHSSADEELILIKMSDSQNPSGGSNGCSPDHEIVTCSLKSDAHLLRTSEPGTKQTGSPSSEDIDNNSLYLRNIAAQPTVAKGYVAIPTDSVKTSTWSPRGVDATLSRSINPNYVPVEQPEPTKQPSSLSDGSIQPSPYVVTGDLNKLSNSSYVPLNSPEMIKNSPAYVIATNKDTVVPELTRLDLVKSTNVENKPAYVQVADASSNIQKVTPGTFTQHEPSINRSTPKTGHVSIGDIPGLRACSDPTKEYTLHQHFEPKTLKED